MEFSLAELRVLESKLDSHDYRQPTAEEQAAKDIDGYHLGFELVKRPETPREFAVIFDCKVKANQLRQFAVVYLARFEATEDVTEEFMASHYAGMNAPAIGYPYLRAYVSQTLLLSGYKPITLPTVNFQEVFRKRSEEKAKALNAPAENAPKKH